MERAAVVFGSIEHFHKHNIATTGLSATASWHTEQARVLRDPASIRAWELRAVKGKCDDHVRATLGQLANTKQFNKCEIETNWPSMTICALDPRVAYSDDKSRSLWKISFACAKEWELRNITYKVGLRRRILLEDEDKKLGKKTSTRSTTTTISTINSRRSQTTGRNQCRNAACSIQCPPFS